MTTSSVMITKGVPQYKVTVTRAPFMSRLDTLLGYFPGAAGSVGIERQGTTYWLYTPIQGGRYLGAKLVPTTILTYTATELIQIDSRMPFQTINETDGSFVTVGTWVTGSNAGAYSGDYKYSQTAGDTATWTTPPNTRAIGLRNCALTNCGVVKVVIDGDPTRATLLTTAQALVDAGTLPSTVLVANGGTLNSTDRVINTRGANVWDSLVLIADDLGSAVHTVVFTITGYQQTPANGARVYFGGLLYNTTATTLATANIVNISIKQVGASGSVYEYAWSTLPTGAVTRTYVGNGHGYESQTGITYYVDGSPVTPADGQILTGATCWVTRTSNLYHPEIGAGATVIATSTITYTADGANGIKSAFSLTWGTTGDVSNGYPGMFPTQTFMNYGANINLPHASVTLGANTGAFVANAQSKAVYVWDQAGYYGALLYAPNTLLNTNNWAWATNVMMAVEDRVGGALNKIYLSRQYGLTETFTNGEVWQGEVWWKITRLSDASVLDTL